ncbi:arylsulfatase, partial [Klebsiella aerogenes]
MNKKYKGIGVLAFAAGSLLPGATANAADQNAAGPSDKMADEGMTFFDFYGQPSSTPGRAAMQTGRIPNRSGMTTVAFQGQGGGLPKEEWTL